MDPGLLNNAYNTMPVATADFDSTYVELSRGDSLIQFKSQGDQNGSTGDILNDDCTASTLGDWTHSVAGTADSPVHLDYANEDTFKLSVPSATSGDDNVSIYKTLRISGTTFVTQIKFMYTLISTISDSETPAFNNMCGLGLAIHLSSTKRLSLTMAATGLYAYLGETGDQVLLYSWNPSLSTWYNVTVAVDVVASTYSIYIDGVLVVDSATQIQTGSGYIVGELKVSASTRGNYACTAYISKILCGTAVSSAFPTESIITLPEIDSKYSDTVWSMNSITDRENLDGEAGTIKYQYATSASTIADYADDTSDYNGTWLTLTELRAITNPSGQYFRLAVQFTGDGSQDASLQDMSITATVPSLSGGGECSAVYVF
jgi:hypothetical protein